MPDFPSAAWMQAYAQTVLDHEQASDLTGTLRGRYRFVVRAGDGLPDTFVHDLVVQDDAIVVEAVTSSSPPADVEILAGYGHWQKLLTGRADVLMSLLLRRLRVRGDLARLRSNAAAGGPLLRCLGQVPTTFPR